MQPIVDGIKKRYRACLQVQRVNFHAETRWHELIGPVGSPEFALLDSNETIFYRWIGFTEKEEFEALISPLCGG